ncbi:MAG TPA: hypothetical protein VK425_04820 [Acidimicrobiales bacterium]|nr:hypothetical protein [Acidimicrobiales bacterium]
MKRSPLSLPTSSARLARCAAGTIACAALVGSMLAGPPVAAASARTGLKAVAQIAPVAGCPGASAVSGAAGVTVPAATPTTTQHTDTNTPFGTITDTTTICVYGAPTSLARMNYVLIVFSHLSRSVPTAQVQPYLKQQLAATTSKMPPGVKWSYRFGTERGVPNLWITGSATIGTFHLSFIASFGYRGTKVAGAEGIGMSEARVDAVEGVAFNAIGL